MNQTLVLPCGALMPGEGVETTGSAPRVMYHPAAAPNGRRKEVLMLTSVLVVIGLSVGAVVGLYWLGKASEGGDDVS